MRLQSLQVCWDKISMIQISSMNFLVLLKKTKQMFPILPIEQGLVENTI